MKSKTLLVLFSLVCLLVWGSHADAAFSVGGRVSPDGKEVVQIDYPAKLASKNTGGTDRSGLCVFTSINYSAHWQNEVALQRFQKQMEGERGGGWPEKVDAMVAKYAPGVGYLQYEGRDLDFLRSVLKSGRLPAVTYSGADGKFYTSRVAHMVNLVHLSERWAAIRDNNYVGENQLLWMSPDEFLDRWTHFRTGWAVVLLAPPPPPVPTLDVEPVPLPEPLVNPCPLCPPRAPLAFSWEWQVGEAGQRNLWHGDAFIGCWRSADPRFHAYQAEHKKFVPGAGWQLGSWPKEVPDYGVRLDYLADTERFCLNGKQVTVEEVARAFGNKSVPADTECLRLTVIGPKAGQVLRDLKDSPVFAPWRGKLVVQAYPEGNKHWHLRGLGFPEDGVVIQEPPLADGRGVVVHQQTGYEGPDSLEGCLRNCNPRYQPSLAPNLSRWGLPAVDVNVVVLVIVTVAVLFLVWRVRR